MKLNTLSLPICSLAKDSTHSLQSLLRKRIKSITHFAVFSALCCLTANLTYAVGVTEDKSVDAANLDQTKLGADSGYTLTESSSANNGSFTITKYIVDPSTRALTAVNYDVNIKEQGDDAGDKELYFKWEEKTTDGLTHMALTQTDTLEEGGLTVKVYSDLNERIFDTSHDDIKDSEGDIINPGAPQTDISNSFAGIEATIADNIASGGGAIGRDDIGTLKGDFIGNSIPFIDTGVVTPNLSGGAIGGIVAVDIIEGNFIGNSAYHGGGAIRTETGGAKPIISGDFIGNTAVTGSGGAIDAQKENMTSITGDFIANRAGQAGGAISFVDLHATTTDGDFFNNYAGTQGGAVFVQNATVEKLTADFSNNSAGEYGGALSITSGAKVGAITGNFIGNTAAERGGAINISAGEVGLLAATQNMYFTGNTVDGKSNAIYSLGSGETITHFNAFNGFRIVVNDGIDGMNHSVTLSRQKLNINAGYAPAGSYDEYKVDEEFNYSTVEFNNTVQNHSINVHNGTLELGVFGGTSLADGQTVAASQALLINNVLTVSKGATVDAYSGAALGETATSNTITNSGVITFSEGNLANDMMLYNGGELKLTSNGDSSSKLSVYGANNKITGTGRTNYVTGTITVAGTATLSANDIALSANVNVTNSGDKTNFVLTNGIITDIELGEMRTAEGVATSSIAGYKGESASVDIKIYDMLNVGAELSALTMDDSITFDIPMTATEFNSHFIASEMEQMLMFQFGEGLGSFGSDYSTALSSGLRVFLNIEGTLHQADYEFVNPDGSLALGFTLPVSTAGVPEPSTATLSLLALTGLLARRRRRVA